MVEAENQLTFIDLFCGCGGFSLGLYQAGLRPLAAIDFNKEAIQVYKRNFNDILGMPSVHALYEDLTQFRPTQLQELLKTKSVDVIIGGPPCQGFSTVRQRDGANNGPRMVKDERRQLYTYFLNYVGVFQPKVFVMENVLGIKSADGGRYFERVQAEARELGYRVHPQIERAYDLGVPQKRVRQLIIGTRGDLPNFFPNKIVQCPTALERTNLDQAISDLPPLKAGEGDEITDYDPLLRKIYEGKYGKKSYLFSVLEVEKAQKLTAHRARPHSDRDLRDFAKLEEGENSASAMRRGIEFEFPYDRSSFKDRYTRQSGNGPCSTIVAHLSKDGLMFVHPFQNRSLTPREAARIQSFPDWFEFPIARTHQFRVIGNAVPPLVGKAVGLTILRYESENRDIEGGQVSLLPSPASFEQANEWLLPVLEMETSEYRKLEPEDLKRMWFAAMFLFPQLHPDAALDHGKKIEERQAEPFVDARLYSPYYVQSGWPVCLKGLAAEANRRFDRGQLDPQEFYCTEACAAGIRYREYWSEENATIAV